MQHYNIYSTMVQSNFVTDNSILQKNVQSSGFQFPRGTIVECMGIIPLNTGSRSDMKTLLGIFSLLNICGVPIFILVVNIHRRNRDMAVTALIRMMNLCLTKRRMSMLFGYD